MDIKIVIINYLKIIIVNKPKMLSFKELDELFNKTILELEQMLSGYGVIYKCTSKTSKKSYIGQAANFICGNRKHGAIGRWKSHINDAYNPKYDMCRVLNAAIRKYSSHDFIIQILGEYPHEFLDTMEKYFILTHNTLVPNGYNIREGGARCRISTSRPKNEFKLSKKTTKGKKLDDIHITNIRNANMGKSYNVPRKFQEDANLPKYITAYRKNGQIYGYVVSKFPIGIEKKEIAPSKRFADPKNTIDKNYKLAVEHLENLKIKYADRKDKLEQQRKNNIKVIGETKEEILKKSYLETKKNRLLKNLPKYIYPIFKGTLLAGYYVENVPDYNGLVYPKIIFNYQNSNKMNLKDAKTYVESLIIHNKNMIFLQQNKKFQKYITLVKDKHGRLRGYVVSNYPQYNTAGNIIGYKSKSFTNPHISFEERSNNAISFMKNL